MKPVEKYNKNKKLSLQVQDQKRETNTNRQAGLLNSYYTSAFLNRKVDLRPGKSRANTCKRKLKLKIGELIV